MLKITAFQNKAGTGTNVPFTSIDFPGGEVHITLDPCYVSNIILIQADLHSHRDVMELLMATDALKRLGAFHIKLYMPYVPNGRQDRVANRGEAHALKVFCDLINAQGYDSVTILDPHSEVTPALLNKCKVVEQHQLIREMMLEDAMDIVPEDVMLISPDAGANKKTLKIAQKLGFKGVIRADKIRETSTGKITGTEVYSGDLGNQDVLIVDDIGDGMGTFLALAAVLRTKTTGKVMLYITHGIFSKGTKVLEGVIDHTFCYRTFLGHGAVSTTLVKDIVFYKTRGEF